MHYDDYNEELARVKVAESGAIGGLKGTVAGSPDPPDVGLEITPKDWERLRAALAGAEAAHKAVVDHLCNPWSSCDGGPPRSRRSRRQSLQFLHLLFWSTERECHDKRT